MKLLFKPATFLEINQFQVKNNNELANKPEDKPGMTQKDLAEKVGCSEAWLCRVLSLQAVGSDDLYEKLYKETQIPRGVLFNGPKKRLKRLVSIYLREQRSKSMCR